MKNEITVVGMECNCTHVPEAKTPQLMDCTQSQDTMQGIGIYIKTASLMNVKYDTDVKILAVADDHESEDGAVVHVKVHGK